MFKADNYPNHKYLHIKLRSNAASVTDIPYTFSTARPILTSQVWTGFCVVLFGVNPQDISILTDDVVTKFIDSFPTEQDVAQFVNFNDGNVLDMCDWLQLSNMQVNQLHYLLTPYAPRTKNLKQYQDAPKVHDISQHATKRIKEIVDVWSECVRIEGQPYRAKKKATPHTLVFLTLTYPTSNKVDALHSKRNHLGAFIQEMKRKGYTDKYLWKMELHESGQIHYHVLSDKKVPHEELRKLWNRVIDKDGHIRAYTNKFSTMSESQYTSYRGAKTAKELDEAKKAYLKGISEGWSSPNTTDVHKVQQTENLAAYVGKYISKKISTLEQAEVLDNLGRLWGCSDELRELEWPKIEYHREKLDDPTTLIYDSLSKLFEVMHSQKANKKILIGEYGQQFIIFRSCTEKMLEKVDRNILCYYLEHYNNMIKLIYG